MTEIGNELSADVHIDIRGRRPENAWPAYLVEDHPGDVVPVPFSPSGITAPAGYEGDYHVDAFTAEAVSNSWRGLEEKDALQRQDALLYARQFGERNTFRTTGTVDPAARLTSGEFDLRKIRRPSYFGSAPYEERISRLDSAATVVEVAVPSDRHHRLFFKESGDVLHLRGWHIRGRGVVTEDGSRREALAVMLGGRGTELTAISHPDDTPYVMTGHNRVFEAISYPNRRTENCNSRRWRDYLADLQSLGFSILALDLRGHGISDGQNASNAYEQGMDVFRILDALETGHGLRTIASDGALKIGEAAAGSLLAGTGSRKIPTLVLGSSQGSMAASYAMHANFVSDLDFSSGLTFGPARGYNFRGAILEAEYAKGLGHWFRVHWDGISSRTSPLAEAALRAEYGIALCPSSEILAGVGQWPALFIGRGLWDSAGSLSGSLDLFRRAGGMKDIAVVRGPHSDAEYGSDNQSYMRDRVLKFAAAVFSGSANYAANNPSDLRELVLSAPPFWDDFMNPV